MPQSRRLPRLASGAAMLLFVSLAACKRHDDAELTPPPPPAVTVAHPLRMTVSPALLASGNAASVRSVDLTARVQGTLQTIAFSDGAMVKTGETLFVIEPAPYQVRLRLAQAVVTGARVRLAGLQAELDRQTELARSSTASAATLQRAQTDRDTAAATLAQAAGAADLAAIEASYTTVAAPFDGRIGRHLIDAGNIVGGPDRTKLATLDQLDPVYVYFSFSEQDVQVIARAMRTANIPFDAVNKAPVAAALETEKGYPHPGQMDFVATGADPNTGTWQARAVFANAGYEIPIGSYVRLRMPLGPPQQALLVPDAALGVDQAGPYLLVVDGDYVVQQRRVTLGARQGGLRVVETGLDYTDRVVIDGLQQAVVLGKVTPTEQVLTATASDARY